MPNIICTGGWRSPFSNGLAILPKFGSFCMCGSPRSNFCFFFGGEKRVCGGVEAVFVGVSQVSDYLYIAYSCYQSLYSAVLINHRVVHKYPLC